MLCVLKFNELLGAFEKNFVRPSMGLVRKK